MNNPQIRFPGAAVRCRTGTAKIWNGPGSGVRHFAPLALHRVRDTRSCP
jgi:hypothetical protein